MPDTPTVAVNSNPDAVQGPDPNRPREFLEQFPLDTLRMVGTLEMGIGDFGLLAITLARTTGGSQIFRTHRFSWWKSFRTASAGF
jgi:type IV pilus assembly protein PilP